MITRFIVRVLALLFVPSRPAPRTSMRNERASVYVAASHSVVAPVAGSLPSQREELGARLLRMAMPAEPAMTAMAALSLFVAAMTSAAVLGFYGSAIDGSIVAAVVLLALCIASAVRRATFDRPMLVGGSIIAAAALMTGVFQHETLLGDYDSGNYSFRALYLARTGDFAPMFLPGYTVFLSAFARVGGFGLQQWANATLLSGTLLALFHLSSSVAGSRWAGVVAVAIFATHYTTLWFGRQALSDNMGVLLLFAALHFLVSGIERRDLVRVAFSFVPMSLMLLSRAEGLLFLIMLGFAFAIWCWRERPRVPVALSARAALAAVSVLVVLNLSVVTLHETRAEGDSYYAPYFDKAIHLTSSALPFVPTVATSRTPVVEDANPAGLPTARDYTLRFVFSSFYKYGLHILFGVGVLGLFWSRTNRRSLVWCGLVLSPILLLIAEPTISWVHPWFMRHYWATLIPFLVVLAARWIASLPDARTALIAGAVLVGLNLFQAKELVLLRDSDGFHDALARVNTVIADRDALVLAEPEIKYVVDPLHFMYGVNPDQPVTFVDVSRPERVAELLDGARGRTVYLVSRRSPADGFAGITLAGDRYYPPDSLEYVGGLSFETKRLQYVVAADRYARPENIPPKPLDQGYGPIAEAVRGLPPRSIGAALYRFHVYRVTGPSGNPAVRVQ